MDLVQVITDDLVEIERSIRDQVFIDEQDVPRNIEYDEFEENSVHFLIWDGDEYPGCIRYRWAGRDIKIERLAVLKDKRGMGYGSRAMRRMLEIVKPLGPERIYLHSQVVAKDFYISFGFMEEGPVFDEAGIDHVKMFYKGMN